MGLFYPSTQKSLHFHAVRFVKNKTEEETLALRSAYMYPLVVDTLVIQAQNITEVNIRVILVRLLPILIAITHH